MKSLLSLIIAFLLSIPLYSQIDETADPVVPNSRLGVRGGLNFAKVDADLGGNTEALQGIHTGIFYQKFFSPSFSLQPEIQYSQEGWEDTGAEYEINYIGLAIVGKYYMFQGLNLQAGVQPELKISSQVDNNLINISLDDDIANFNLHAVFGVGYDFGFGLNIGGRYLQGLLDVNEDYQAVSTKDNEIKLRNIQVYVGYSIPLPKSRRAGFGPG